MKKFLLELVALCFVNGFAMAQESSGPGFGSPNAVENQVEYDFGEAWDAWKQNLKDDFGVVLSVDYTAVMLTANETFDDKEGTGGIARIFGTFDHFNVENGTLVWKFEHRHAYGSVSPFDFSLDQVGYVGLQEPPFNDSDFRTQNLYWRQRMNNGRSVLIAGILDATDYLDAYALASPWLHFMNFAFSTGSATIGLPNDAAVGVAYGTMLTDRFYLVAGITDTNTFMKPNKTQFLNLGRDLNRWCETRGLDNFYILFDHNLQIPKVVQFFHHWKQIDVHGKGICCSLLDLLECIPKFVVVLIHCRGQNSQSSCIANS